MRTLFCKHTHRFNFAAGLVGIAALTLTSCTLPQRVQRIQMDQPVYSCVSDKGTVIGDKALIRVRNAEWAERATRMGMDQLQPQMRAQMGEGAYARPKATFLLVDLEVDNISKAPISWINVYGGGNKTYKLVSKDGITYNYENDLGDIIYKLGNKTINPGMAEVGRIVFDVPKGNYDFLITQTSLTGRTGYNIWYQEANIFRCSLQLL